MTRGIDTDQSVIGCSSQIKKEGFDFVFRYVPFGSKTYPVTTPEIVNCHASGLGVGFIVENGFPTDATYFTPGMATAQAVIANKAFVSLNVPTNIPAFFAIDYDANPQVVLGYFSELHFSQFHKRGWPIGVYASDAVCRAISEAGYASYFWVAFSNGGWAGSDNPFVPANIRQSNPFTLCGLDVDGDIAIDGDYGAWLPAAKIGPATPGTE